MPFCKERLDLLDDCLRLAKFVVALDKFDSALDRELPFNRVGRVQTPGSCNYHSRTSKVVAEGKFLGVEISFKQIKIFRIFSIPNIDRLFWIAYNHQVLEF